MQKEQEFKVKINGQEAIVIIKTSGWLRKRREVIYNLSQISKRLLRKAFSMLEVHVLEKLRKRSFEFHIHFHT